MSIISPLLMQSVPGTYWQWRGNSIYYLCAGEKSSKPPLLLVHGFGASTDHWRKNIAALQQQFQVWAIDLLGFGRSAKPKQEYNGNLWREQLHDFITEVIGEPTVLAGNSLGGYASLCVAAEYPQSTAGLILLNSAGPFSDSEPPVNSTQQSRRNVAGILRSLLLQPWASFILFQYARRRSIIRKTLNNVYFDSSAVTEQLVEDIYRPSCDRGAADVFNSVFKTPQGEKIDVLLSKMQCPLLLLWGEKDPWINAREKGVQFRQYYPQLTEHYLKAGHCPHDEIPEQVNALITDWVFSIGELQS